MKKKLLALLLAALMVVSLVPMTVFATGTTYAITNGTPGSAKETNHGYIAIDKATAAEGETVTITVTPAEGYQLKKLTVLSAISIAPPITPAQDASDKTKYTFKMPSYPVRVTAEFEAVGGTGKTLPYSFDFESDFIAAGWTNIDANGDGQDWITATNIYGAEGWGVEGSRCAISQSYDSNLGAFNADNWLFSPAITIPEGGATVSWYEQSQDVSYPDFYEVYVSETNTSTDTSKMTKIFSGIAANPWNQRSVELEAAECAGKTVYIAFRHKEYDEFYLEIDNFAAEAVAPVHTHAFTYTANNGKITATCVDGCDKGYDTNPLTLTLTAPTSLVYDGNAKAFTFADGEAAAWTGAGLELPTIYYYEKKDYPFYMGIDSAPTDAGGDYMVEITVNKKAAQIYFTIDKATPYIKTNPEPTDIVYGKKLSDSTLVGGYVQISSADSSEVGGLFEWTNPDTAPGIDDSEVTLYDVTFTPADTNNYNTVSCKITIKVTHTHNLIKVTGQAATETAAGFKDYYECECGDLFEDATGLIPIENLDDWKAQGGSGYIPSGKEIKAARDAAKEWFENPLNSLCLGYYSSELVEDAIAGLDTLTSAEEIEQYKADYISILLKAREDAFKVSPYSAIKKEIEDICKALGFDNDKTAEILSDFDEFISSEYNNETRDEIIGAIAEKYGMAQDDAAKQKAVRELYFSTLLMINSNWMGESSRNPDDMNETLIRSLILFDDNDKIAEAIDSGNLEMILMALLECYPDYAAGYSKVAGFEDDTAFDTVYASLRNAAKTDKAKIELTAAKTEAIEAVTQAFQQNASEETKAIAEQAIKDIEAAETVSKVEEIKSTAISEIQSVISSVCPHCGQVHKNIICTLVCYLMRAIRWFFSTIKKIVMSF